MQRVNSFRIARHMAIGLSLMMLCSAMAQSKRTATSEQRKLLIERGLLKSDDPNVQRIALVLLGEIGFDDPLGPKIAPRVIELLESTADPVLKREGIQSLGRINPSPRKATPVFQRYLQDSDTSVRQAAVKGLESWLLNATSGKWWTAPEPLPISFGLAPAAVDIAWAEDHIDALAGIRDYLRSMEVFEGFITRIEEGLPLVGNALSDPDKEVRSIALELFEKGFQRLSPDIVAEITRTPDLIAGLDLTENRVKTGRKIFEKVISTELRKLTPLLQSGSNQEKLRALQILELAGIARRPFRPNDAPVPMRVAAPRFQLVARQQPADAPMKDVADAKKEPNPVKDTLREILLAHTSLAKDPEVAIRQTYANAIETLGADAEVLTPTILEISQDPIVYVRWTAIRTMGKVAPKQADVILPVLSKIISEEKDLDVRANALLSLAQFGDKGNAGIQSVLDVMGRGDADTRIVAIQIVPQLKAAPEVIVPGLAKALLVQDDDDQSFSKVRLEAARVLYDFGAQARPAVNELTEALRDPDKEIRRLCAETLLKIGQAKIDETDANLKKSTDDGKR